MASYNELNALIDAYINRNGVQAITGQILNGVLKAMVEQLGRGYTIMGVALPATDPGTPDGPECYFASTPGTYTDFDGLQVVSGELALLCYTPSDGWTKATIYEGFESVQATIDGNVGTPAVNVTYVNGVLSFDFSNMKGNTGAAAGFGNVTAAVDGTIGTPGVTVQTSGPDTAKNMTFQFTNLKGETGVTSVVVTVDNTTGTPACAVSLNGQELHLDFTGLKGAQGDTGSSVDYPFTIVNNLTTDDATQALSAAQGVILQGEITQLELKVDELALGKFYGFFADSTDLPEGDLPGYAYVGESSPFEIYTFQDGAWEDSETTLIQTGDIYYTPEMYGAKGDGITDDTEAFEKLNGKNVQLSEKTYLVTSLQYDRGTRINGCGIDKSIIKQAEDATGDCIKIAGAESAITNLTILGHRELNTVGDNVWRALLKVYGVDNGSSNYFHLENVAIKETTYSGLILIGSATGDPSSTAHNSWVFHINNIFVKKCGCWCMIDETSDNTFSNVSISYGGLGGMWARNAGSNMYVNFKLDGQSGFLGSDPESWIDSCLLLISNNSGNLRFVNLDCQSGQYGGIKIVNSNKIYINGDINNCGIGYGNPPTGAKGALLAIKNSVHIDFLLCLFRMYKTHYLTKYGVYIENDCQFINGFVQNVFRDEIVNLSPDTCVVRQDSDNPYIDEPTIDRIMERFSVSGASVDCYPVDKYRLDVVSLISAQESVRKLSVNVFGNSEMTPDSYSGQGSINPKADFSNGPTWGTILLTFDITTDYANPESRLIQVFANGTVMRSLHPTANERTCIFNNPNHYKIERVTIFAGKNAADSTGHIQTINSLSLREVLSYHEIDLGANKTDATYRWKTGELDENGAITKYDPTYIYAGSGKNTLSGNTSSITVSGAKALDAPQI